MPTGYPYTMTLYAQVLRIDGTYIDSDASMLAAFGPNGGCRGAFTPIQGPKGRLFALTIASNQSSEKGITLQVFDADAGQALPIAETLDFAVEAVLPSITGLKAPMQLHIDESAILWTITVAGCSADKARAARGQTVSLAAVLPEGEDEADYDFEWQSQPTVDFAAAGAAASFEMPGEPISVTCAATRKTPTNTDTCRILYLKEGWNLVVLSLMPDEASIAQLRKYPAMTLDTTNQTYIQVQDFSAENLYWIYSSETETEPLIVTGEPAEQSMPQDSHVWAPYGTYPETLLEGYEIIQWLEGSFQHLPMPQLLPGHGYFLRRSASPSIDE